MGPGVISEIKNKIRTKGKKYTLWYVLNKLNRRSIRVSIIMPVYNASQYLRECLTTVQHQSLKNIEIICVNDGSKDNSLEILKEFAAQDSRFRIIDKENTGAGDCRNIGLKEARGEYVLFLDADDLFDNELCEKAYYNAMTKKADICFFGSKRFNMQTQKMEAMNWVLRKELLPHQCPFQKEDLGNKFFQLTTGCPWSKLFRRDFILEHHLEFMKLKNANDLYFVRAAMALAKNMTYINEPLVIYRFGGNSSIQASKYKSPLDFFKAYCALKERLVSENIYAGLEQSFINLVFDDCIFNMRTMQTEESRLEIRNFLLLDGFKQFKISERPENYFYNAYSYKEYKQMMQ